MHTPEYSRRHHTAFLQSVLRAVLCQQERSTACHTNSRQQPLYLHLGMSSPSADDPLNYLVWGTGTVNIHWHFKSTNLFPFKTFKSLLDRLVYAVNEIGDVLSTICPSEQRYSNEWSNEQLVELTIHHMKIHHPSSLHKKFSLLTRPPSTGSRKKKSKCMLPVRQTHNPSSQRLLLPG